MSTLLSILAGICILGGAMVVAIAALGLFRLPDSFTRMHAATKAGVLGSGLLMLGVGLSLGSASAIITGLAGVAFLLATSPLASHALGRAAYVSGAPIASATVADALSGVLPRNVFDIAPGRVVRGSTGAVSAHASSLTPGGSAMSAGELRTYQMPATAPGALPLRAVTAWLVGGPSQSDASAIALDIARAAEAKLTGLSALDAEAAQHHGPVPAGGIAWARWLGDQRRTRMRERAAKSIAEFDGLCAGADIAAQTRHEERAFSTLITAAAGADILIAPAGVDRIGEPATYSDEIAMQLSVAGVAPVLRVRRRPLAVRRVMLLVSNAPRANQLAHALIRSGLWRDATVSVVTAGTARTETELLAREQGTLLEQHGFRATIGDPIDLETEREDMTQRLATFEAVVCATLSHRRGWFGAVREDVHEIAAQRNPLILLP
jgi:monovalent cation/proton antiporter MnhG/PhaG subunit